MVGYRYARFDEYPEISRFLNEHWAADHVYVRKQELFEWTFRRSRHWDDDTYSFAVAEDNSELVGILGGIPFTFNTFGKTSKGIWIVNYVIRPDHRRGSTALQLLSMFRKPPFQAVIAFGINPATSSIYRVLRGQVLDEIPRHFLVLPGAQARMINLLQAAYPDWPVDRARELGEAFRIDALPADGVRADGAIPEDWDEAQWPHLAAETAGAARDSDYLTWRYMQHPNFKHRFITARDGSRIGLAVWRLETIRRETPQGRKDVDRIGRLLEFLPASRDNARELLTKFLQDLSSCDALGADYYGYHGPTRMWAQEFGFRATQSVQDGPLIPSRFQPLDGKGGGIMSAMFLNERLPPCSPDAQCSWYWTKSDSDQDRPN